MKWFRSLISRMLHLHEIPACDIKLGELDDRVQQLRELNGFRR